MPLECSPGRRASAAARLSALLIFTNCATIGSPPPGLTDPTISSRANQKQQTDRLLDVLAAGELAMGSVAISVGGVPRYSRAIGWDRLDPGTRLPSTVDSRYRIGSVSKLFTAAVIFQLIEGGELKLDDRLSRFVPGLPRSGDITIGDLLHHRSGLPDYSEAEDFADWKYRTAPRDALIGIIAGMTSAAVPDSAHAYSNSNYLLLSHVIEAIAGRPYATVVQERILGPLQLENTYFEAEPDSIRRTTRSYSYANGEWSQERDDVAANHSGAGALVSTPSDLLRFVDALFAGRVVSAESLERMTSFVGDYGMGLFVFRIAGRIGYGHGGRINENYTRLIHFPTEKLSIAYSTNGVLYPATNLLEGIVRIWTDQPSTPPDFTSAAGLPPDVDAYLGTYRSEAMGLTVVSKRIGEQLVIETAGTDFPAQVYGIHRFANVTHGFFFEFDPEGGRLIIKERDNVYVLTK